MLFLALNNITYTCFISAHLIKKTTKKNMDSSEKRAPTPPPLPPPLMCPSAAVKKPQSMAQRPSVYLASLEAAGPNFMEKAIFIPPLDGMAALNQCGIRTCFVGPIPCSN